MNDNASKRLNSLKESILEVILKHPVHHQDLEHEAEWFWLLTRNMTEISVYTNGDAYHTGEF